MEEWKFLEDDEESEDEDEEHEEPLENIIQETQGGFRSSSEKTNPFLAQRQGASVI